MECRTGGDGAGASAGRRALSPPQTTPEQPRETRPPDYQEIEEGLLEQNQQYSKQAVLAGIEGGGEISFLVNTQGTVLGYTIVRSSREPARDDELVRLIHRVRFPPVPGGVDRTRLPIGVTIEFSLH